MAEINSLYFDDLEVENEFRKLLKSRLIEDDIYEMFDGGVNLIPIEFDVGTKVDLPAVSFYIYQNKSLFSDDEQIQRYTPFNAEINIYTSGDNKITNNRLLCNKLIKLFQSNGSLDNYYCRGLSLRENSEVGSVMDSVYRRVLRFDGLCDNKQKLIKGER